MSTAGGVPRWLKVALAASLALAALGIGGLVWLSRQAQRVELVRLGSMPAFRLTDQDGKPAESAQFTGKPLVVSFIYTNCPDICPMTTAHMRQLQARLQQEGVADVTLLSISVDPERDTPEVLRQYAARYGADTRNWRFLTGDPGHVREVVVSGFKIAQEKPAGHDHGGHDNAGANNYLVTHSGKIVLVDRQGQIRAYYDVQEFNLDRVLLDLKQLL
jgi:protein SCO1/2